MEPDTNNKTTLCGGGCGFYGSPATDNLCSKCFKDALKRKQDVNRQSPTSSVVPKTENNIGQDLEFPPTTSALSQQPMAIAKSEAIPIKTMTTAASASSLEVCPSPIPSMSSSPSSSIGIDSDSSNTNQPHEKKKNRCQHCNKKVGFTGFECRCGGLYCGVHRYSDMHQCGFDYKALGAEEIRQNNPVVKTEKIQKL